MDKIKLYHKICEITNNNKSIVNILSEEAMNVVFTNEQKKLIFEKQNVYKLAETVLGGEAVCEINSKNKIIVY